MRVTVGAVLLVLFQVTCTGTPVPIPTPIEARHVALSSPTSGGVVVGGSNP